MRKGWPFFYKLTVGGIRYYPECKMASCEYGTGAGVDGCSYVAINQIDWS